MRNGRREVLVLLLAFLGGTAVAAAPFGSLRAGTEDPVAITVQVNWTVPGGDRKGEPGTGPGAAPELILGASEGRVIEAAAWPVPPASSAERPRAAEAGQWSLGTGTTGRARVRLETKLTADLVFRRGEQVLRMPVAALLERTQQTPPQSPLGLTVERLPWDSLIIELGKGAEEGIVAAAAPLPISVRYNLLWPDAAELTVRTTAQLRPIGGGEPVWKEEQRETVPANRPEPSSRLWTIPAPRAEGTYVLEVHAAWEPTGVREGTRLGRLIRRRKAFTVANTASRRMTLAVIGPHERSGGPGGAAEGAAREGQETEVDNLDLGRIRNSRFSAWGRSPTVRPGRSTWAVPPDVLLVAGARERDRDRLTSWISRPVAEAASLGPADDAGLAWSAVSLHVARPDRPHRLTLTVTGGDPSALGVAVLDAGGAGKQPRVVLDACASGPPILKDGPPASFSWYIWPDTPELLLVLLNRNASGTVRLGAARLHEIAVLPPAPAVRLPGGGAARTMGLYLADDGALDRFGGVGETGLADALEVARNLGSYLSYCGASLVVLPERRPDRELRAALKGQADENAIGPDRYDVLLRVLQRQGCSAWVELKLDRKDSLPGLPPPDSAEALRRGLVRINRQGWADEPAYHPLHPEVRQAMRRRVEEALARRGGAPAYGGVLLRLGTGPTLLGTPDTGLDDETFARFVKETFGPETAGAIPGLATTSPDRFAARGKYLAGVGRMPWLTWRSRAIAGLYGELAEAVRTAAPGATLAVATPALHGGAAGAEARQVDLAGLAPSQAWRSVGLDLQAWPTGPDAPIVLRGVELSDDALARDLASNPDLDAKVAPCTRRGMLLTIDPGLENPARELAARGGEQSGEGDDAGESAGPAGAEAVEGPKPGSGPAEGESAGKPGGAVTLSALPLGDGANAEEPLGHALAALDAQWVILAEAAVAGHEERLRRYVSVLRALPAWPAQSLNVGGQGSDYGVSVRSLGDATQSYVQIANDTPYAIRLAGVVTGPAAAPVEDLGRGLRLMPQAAAGGRLLVLDLLPFGISAIRIGAPGVQMSEITPYPTDAVLTSMEARYKEISSQLARLNRGAGSVGAPPNAGFEPEPARIRQARSGQDAAAAAASPVWGGWKVEGGAGGAIALDAHTRQSGKTSLKLTAPVAPASVVSGDFVPVGTSSTTIQAHFRCDPSGARVRVWIEGEADGQAYLRRSEFAIATDWELKAVRAADLPAGGLDTARLRFELITPGTLWIDGLRVLGEAAPRAVRLNAQRTLMAAMQAYRAQRFAEFARLSSSHWARHPSILAATRGPQAGGLSEAEQSDPASASALSPDRRLR